MVAVLPLYETTQVAFIQPELVGLTAKSAEPPPIVEVPLPLLPLAIKHLVSLVGLPSSLRASVPPSMPALVLVSINLKVDTPVVGAAANDRITK